MRSDDGRGVCSGSEADLGRGGGDELRLEEVRCEDLSRFLNLGGEPLERPWGGRFLVENGRPGRAANGYSKENGSIEDLPPLYSLHLSKVFIPRMPELQLSSSLDLAITS